MKQRPHIPVDLAIVLAINIVIAVLFYCGMLLHPRFADSGAALFA
jgi:hypothetical protein